MTWTSVLANVHFFNGTESWATSSMVAMTSTEQTDFLSQLKDMYDNSPTFAAALDGLVLNGDSTGGHFLNVLGGHTSSPEAAGNFQINTSSGSVQAYYFRLDNLDDSGFFTNNGTLVPTETKLTIAHEIWHGISGLADPSPNDSDGVQNADGYDFDGAMVDFQNIVADELGWADRSRASYQGQLSDSFISGAGFEWGREYTNDAPIDEMRYGLPTADLIDHSGKTDDANDLIFGLWGDDTLKGADGNDAIYGGDDDDVVEGGAGNDFLWGEDGSDNLSGGSGSDTLIGGSGDDTLAGGDGDDVIAPGGGGVIMTGGDGDDVFWLSQNYVTYSSGRTPDYIITDADEDDVLVYNGYQITSGTWATLDKEVHPTFGYEYRAQNLDFGSGSILSEINGDLLIVLPSNEVVLIENWSEGMMGITLQSNPGGHPDTWTSTNIWLDGMIGNYDDITSRALAQSTMGSWDDPALITYEIL